MFEPVCECRDHYLCVCVCLGVSLCVYLCTHRVRSSYYYGSSYSGIAGDCGRCADRLRALQALCLSDRPELNMLHRAQTP